MGKMLVAYFSATGHTKTAADSIAKMLDCEIVRIEPVKPYNFDNPISVVRSVFEQLNPYARIQLKDGRIDMSQYDIVFLAEPIWLGTMPKAVKTFIEENDLSGKIIFNVCTGGSDDGTGNLNELKRLIPDDAIIAGSKKFDEDVTEADVISWIQEF